MKYAEMLAMAREAKTTRELAPVFIKWEEEGQTVVGKLLTRSIAKSRANDGQYVDYVVDTDDGIIKFHCGNQFDEKVGNTLLPNVVYAWTFKGKRDIGKGRRVNEFSCEYVGPGGAEGELGISEEPPI